MAHPDHQLRITLYPMFHIGSQAFYHALSEDFTRFRVFLLEGVRWRGFRGPLYDLAARNLGLAAQQDRLQLPPGAERVPLDMSEGDFTLRASALPMPWRLSLRLLRPILWVVTATTPGRHAVWDAISKDSYVRGLRNVEGPLDQLIKTDRDRAMSACLRSFAQERRRIDEAQPVAVVAGAAHMPALYETLRECGYEKRNVRWFEVLDGISVPSRRTDGRVH